MRLIDGTGTPARTGALRFVGDTIVAVGSVRPGRSDAVIDGRGLVLAPGFIDTHSHHDRGLSRTPDAAAAVSQGITTIVAGNDGGHPFPLAAAFDSLALTGHAVNIAFYAGHGTLRSTVMGEDFRRPATQWEVDSMAALLRAELASGALGLSTGLEYDPGIYSERSEVLALARVAAQAGGRYISHIRSEDRYFFDAIDEIITIGRDARLPVQVSHLKLGMIPLWGMADSLLALLDAARADGVDITADVYPYTYWQSTITVLFPQRDFDNRREAETILRDIVRPPGLRLGAFAPNPAYAGKTLDQIAGMRREDPASTLMGLIREAQAFRRRTADPAGAVVVENVIATGMDEADVATLLAWEHSNVCSDGQLAGPHPRGYGAFPRVLGRYVREQRLMTLETAIRKMAALGAEHLGLRRRGTLAAGAFADLVLFDPDSVSDRATPDQPHLTSSGIARVWVNGQTVWLAGATTGQLPGRIIRREPR